MISIEQLPVEMLMEIFRYLPNYGQVSLVNKLFYNVVCNVNDVCVNISLNSTTLVHLNHQSIMYSIQDTRRRISKVCISSTVDRSSELGQAVWFDVLKILRKSAATIKYLKVERTNIEVADFLEILSCVPNVQYLCIYKVLLATHSQFNNECLKLYHLRTLKLIKCDKNFIFVFGKLPARVLNKLTITNAVEDFGFLADFLIKQSNIKKFQIKSRYDFIMIWDRIVDHLNLESLKCYQLSYDSRYAEILSKQTHLKSLKLRNIFSEVDKSVLNAITNQLHELEIFEVSLNDTLVVPCERIAKLKKLKTLTISSRSLKIFETISGLDNFNFNINSLNIWIDDDDSINASIQPMPIDWIPALANSVPKLKTLLFGYTEKRPFIAVVMEHFNFVDVLEIRFKTEHLNESIDVDRSFNAKLTKLIIYGDVHCDKGFDTMLTQWIDIYPNLEKLRINVASLKMSHLKEVVNGFQRMDSLQLYFQQDPYLHLTADCLDCIKDHKTNWKLIRLIHVNDLTAENRQKLGTVFDVIKYKYSTLVMANRKFLKSTFLDQRIFDDADCRTFFKY